MQTRHKALCATALVVLVCAALAACATQPHAAHGYGVPGFWWGLIHGVIAPFALVGHLFRPDIRMYAFPNAGGWYDFGFFLGIAVLGGGAGASRG